MPHARLARFAWAVLLYTLGVILWGAYVRATGSGAGCGSHWPLCNGEVVPRSPSIETLIEFSHRVTSGLALIAVIVLLVWVWRACAPGHPARRGAAWSVFFMLTEAAVGAGLVLFQLVADNASMARALFMAAHLVNTFILIAFIALTAWWLSGAPAVRIAGQGRRAAVVGAGAVALLVASMSGAVAALGDTLFPSTSLAEALRADLSATSHVLIRLRVLHPALAVAAGLLTTAIALGRFSGGDRVVRPLGQLVVALVGVQIAGGLLNVLLLAPVWMQIVHLLVADALWLAYVLFGASVLAGRRSQVSAAAAPAAATWTPRPAHRPGRSTATT